jgi:hypothetical protein
VGEGDTSRGVSRLRVPEAAQALGISPEAVRNRLSRGTLNSERERGTVFVLLEADRVRHTGDIPSDRPADMSHEAPLIEEMREHLEDLRTQLEAERQAHSEARRLLAAALERIPAIEAPASPEPSEAPTTATEQPGSAEPQTPREGAQEGAGRPWWRRVFGG